jgi:hypothetical protein
LEGALTKKETHFDFFEFSLIQFLLGMNAGGHRVGGWSRRQWLTINSNRNTEMVLLWHLRIVKLLPPLSPAGCWRCRATFFIISLRRPTTKSWPCCRPTTHRWTRIFALWAVRPLPPANTRSMSTHCDPFSVVAHSFMTILFLRRPVRLVMMDDDAWFPPNENKYLTSDYSFNFPPLVKRY